MCLGIPGKIIKIYTFGSTKMAEVDFGGVQQEVCIETVPEAKLDDYVIVHAGFALNILSNQEAAETLAIIAEMSHLADLEGNQ